MTDPAHPRVPAWASLLNPARYARFVDLVFDAIRTCGVDAARSDADLEIGCVVVVQPDGSRASLGLLALLQVCHPAPADDWARIVTDHFAKIFGADRSDGIALEARLLADFALARPHLRVRLYPADALGADALVARVDLDRILTTLVLDLPWSVRALQPADVARFGRSDDELFAIALDNVFDRCVPDIERAVAADGTPLVFLSSRDGDFFAASHALLLDRHAEVVGAHGALVGVPHRHLVTVHPIDDHRVVDAVNRLAPLVRRCHAEGPGSIDPDLFWYREGRFLRLPMVEDAAGGQHFAPPEEFTALVGRLLDAR